MAPARRRPFGSRLRETSGRRAAAGVARKGLNLGVGGADGSLSDGAFCRHTSSFGILVRPDSVGLFSLDARAASSDRSLKRSLVSIGADGTEPYARRNNRNKTVTRRQRPETLRCPSQRRRSGIGAALGSLGTE